MSRHARRSGAWATSTSSTRSPAWGPTAGAGLVDVWQSRAPAASGAPLQARLGSLPAQVASRQLEAELSSADALLSCKADHDQAQQLN